MKQTKRKGFDFLRSYHDVYYELDTNEQKIEFIEAILNKQFHGLEPDLNQMNKMVRFAYLSQKHHLDKSASGWEHATGETLRDPSSLPNGDTPQGSLEGDSKILAGDTARPLGGPPEDPRQQEQEKEQEKEEKKEQEQENNLNHSLTQFNTLMKLFGEPLKFLGSNRKEWDDLTAWEKEKAYKSAEDYLKVEQKSLRFYLMDKKWEMDLTIPNKANKITDPTDPNYDWTDPNNYY